MKSCFGIKNVISNSSNFMERVSYIFHAHSFPFSRMWFGRNFHVHNWYFHGQFSRFFHGRKKNSHTEIRKLSKIFTENIWIFTTKKQRCACLLSQDLSFTMKGSNFHKRMFGLTNGVFSEKFNIFLWLPGKSMVRMWCVLRVDLKQKKSIE